MDASRNALIRIDVAINMATLSIACGGTIAAVFGMNLESGLETAPGAFLIAAAGVTCLATVTFFGLYGFARWRLSSFV